MASSFLLEVRLAASSRSVAVRFMDCALQVLVVSCGVAFCSMLRVSCDRSRILNFLLFCFRPFSSTITPSKPSISGKE